MEERLNHAVHRQDDLIFRQIQSIESMQDWMAAPQGTEVFCCHLSEREHNVPQLNTMEYGEPAPPALGTLNWSTGPSN